MTTAQPEQQMIAEELVLDRVTEASLEVSARILEVFASDAELDDVLKFFCLEAENYIGAQTRASVLVVEDGAFVHCAGPKMPPGYLEVINGVRVGENVGTCGTAVARGERVIAPDIATDPAWSGFRQLAADYQLEAAWSFPVFVDDSPEALGVLAVYVERGRLPTKSEEQVLQELATIAGLAIRRAQLESTLFVERRKLAHVLEGTNIGIWELSIPMGQTSVSASGLDIFGLPHDDPFATDLEAQLARIHPDDRERVEEAYRRHAEGESELVEIVLRMQHVDGRWLSIQSRVSVVERDQNGAPLRAVGTLQDVTAQRRAQAQLHRLEQLESLGKLAGGIAHDFNNLLVGVYGGTELALASLEGTDVPTADLRLAQDSLGRARNLTRQLLTFAKGGTPVVTDVDVAAIACEVLRFDTVRSGIETRLNVAPELWHARADASQLQQVFANLVVNAREAIDGAGTIEVSLANRDVLGADEGVETGPYVHAMIRDSGRGVSAENLSRVFDPYFTTKSGGMGVGLATVRSILTRHGGSITATSEPGHGTTFSLLIPAAAGACSQEASRTGRPQREAATGALNVLVVDDEPLVRRVASSMLYALGHAAVCVSCGTAAEERYRALMDSDQAFDLILLDMTIPDGVGGIEALTIFRELDPEAKVIASTGYTDSAVLAEHKTYGFDGVLPKPYSVDELRRVLEAVKTP